MISHSARIVLTLASATTVAFGVAAPAADADPGTGQITDYGGGCVIDPTNAAVTVNSLRYACSLDQQNTMFTTAPRGTVPVGVRNGWVTTPPTTRATAPAFWIGKTFYTGPDGGYVMNRLTPAGIEGIRATVYSAPGIADGAPVWALNYAGSPLPQIYDEMRRVTPTVWLGYSWQLGAGPPTLMLTFALA